MFYACMLGYFAELLRYLKKDMDADRIEAQKSSLITAVEEYCWDGKWYIRAFGENDRKIGSDSGQFGKIFLNPQIWSVIAGFPDKNRITQAMDSVKELLDSPEGPKKCSPAWKEIDPNIGLVTRCVWGKKENGAVFCHPSAWVIQAETMLGRGNQAFDYFRKMLPNRIDSDIFTAEPYVLSQYITSNEHEYPGRASHSWQTGSAAWMYRVGYDHILGLHPTYEGLKIDPVIPSVWTSFHVSRKFRGIHYHIHVINPEGVEKGVKEIRVDGKLIFGTILPLVENDACQVEVVLGK
jgi:cellobiose phosphorylase